MLDPRFLARPIAHRALHGPGRAENSLEAVQAAVAAGYGIEIDLQMSGDGGALVFHDATLDRMTAQTGPLAERKARDIVAIPLKGGGTIPTLARVLAAVAGRVPLLLEIKDQSGMLGPGLRGLESAVARDLDGYPGPVAVMSFNPHVVALMARLAPHVVRGLTTCEFMPRDWPGAADLPGLRAIAAFDAVGAAFVSHHWRDLDSRALIPLRDRAVPVLCWTIRNPQDEAFARRLSGNITFEGYVPRA